MGTKDALELPYTDISYDFLCPLQLDQSLPLDQQLAWPFGTGLVSPGSAETLLQTFHPHPETTLGLSSPLPLTVCHPASGGQIGDEASLAGSASPAPPPTPPPSVLSPPPLDDDILDDDSPASLEHLQRVLHRRYPSSKPPSRIFANFISKRDRFHCCNLCTKKIKNREQMNQHIMKVHCKHFPFTCSTPGW